MHTVQRSARFFLLHHHNLAYIRIDGRVDVNVETPVTAVLTARAARVAQVASLSVLLALVTDDVEETEF